MSRKTVAYCLSIPISNDSRLLLYTLTLAFVRITLPKKSTVMSADPNTVVPENAAKDDAAAAAAAACSERPSLNGVARASSPSNFESVVSSEDDDPVSAVASSVAPTSTDETVPADVPDANVAGASSSSDDKVSQPVVTKKKVGYDRGFEADHIVGATEKGGKLMFLVAWKNSADGEADLLEATEVYEKSPQVAIKFFEERLSYIPPDERHCSLVLREHIIIDIWTRQDI
ncbi:hypothetical protein AGLY_001923 [Aphis glycines]|uniref:Chromo domain-containing protein n=1 Tax=Aphis glycines TaxID=307491 RepID=A0A6G0U4A5_APHGL|nr:hypothetical protein AGLY_001923 [Aphis glycines]